MFSGGDEEFFGLGDFEFNFNMQNSIQDLQMTREYSRNITYISDDEEFDDDDDCSEADEDEEDQSDDNSSSPPSQRKSRLWADDWFSILEFVGFADFPNFSKVCLLFAELLTFNRRYLVMKAALKEFPKLLKDSYDISVESLENLIVSRAPSDDPSFAKGLVSDLISFLIEKKRFKRNLFNYIPKEKIPLMDQNLFIAPFRSSMIEKTFWDFPTVPEILRNDKSFIMKLFNSHTMAPNLYEYLSNDLKRDRDIILRTVSCNGWFLTKLEREDLDSEIVNTALQSKKRIEVNVSDMFEGVYYQLFKKCYSLLLFDHYYTLANEKSLLNDQRKSYDAILSLLSLDKDNAGNHCEFILQMIYFTSKKRDEICSTFLHFHNIKTNALSNIELHDVLTQIVCFPETFPYLTEKTNVHEVLKCSTKQITAQQVANKILDNAFDFALILDNKEMILTKSSMDYLRDRIINRKKITSEFAKRYYRKQFENMKTNDESEKLKFLQELEANREVNLKMLKYYPQYYSQLSEEWKNDEEFINIALTNLKANGKYFDFTQNETLIVRALTANMSRSLSYFKSNLKYNLEKIKNIVFHDDWRIKQEWINYPSLILLFAKYFSKSEPIDSALVNYLSLFEKLSTKKQAKFVKHVITCIPVTFVEKLKQKNILHRNYGWYQNEKVRNSLVLFTHLKSYKLAPIDLCKKLLENNMDSLGKVLRQNPKFIKVFFKQTRKRMANQALTLPYSDIRQLAREYQKIIHYLPKNLQYRINNPLIF